MTPLFKKIKTLIQEFQTNQSKRNKAIYRVIEINQQDGEYTISVQVVGKNVIFKATPQELLADDNMTNGFSQQDVRNITYLGYDNINKPKYKILAKQQGDNNETVFAIHRKGEKAVQIKTASELSNDTDILNEIDQFDAHMVGFTAGSETVLSEKQAKLDAQKMLKNNRDSSSEKKSLENE